MKSQLLGIAILLASVLPLPRTAHADPVVQGFAVETYAMVSDPVGLSFAPNGDLYVGRDLLGSGGDPGDPTRIHRVLAGGSFVEEFGGMIDDPDAVLFDANGTIAPNANSVLVGSELSLTTGAIYAIAPGGSVTTVFGPTSAFINPSDMVFDGSGRLLFTDHQNQDVKVTSGGTPSVLLSISSRTLDIAYDAVTDRVYTSAVDGVIRAHSSNGTVINAAFGNGRGVAVGPGFGSFGNFVYSIDNGSGELFQIDLNGNATVIGTGFVSVNDLAFGPDGALYASEFDDDRILRIAPEAVPAVSEWGLIAMAILLIAIGLVSGRQTRLI